MNKKAVLSQGGPRDAAVNFGTYQSRRRHRAVFIAIAWLFRIEQQHKSRQNNSVKYVC